MTGTDRSAPSKRHGHRLRAHAVAVLIVAFASGLPSLLPIAGATRLSPIAAAHAAPLIVAHRGGTGDMPENTVEAFRSALDHGADALWMTVQLSQDGVPVLYRPKDLSAVSNGHGPVSHHTVAELQRLNMGYRFTSVDAHQHTVYPYRTHPVSMPTLREALAAVPPEVPVLLDMKQTPAAPLVAAVAKMLSDTQAWSRVRLYSTDPSAIRLVGAYPQAQRFETRDATRQRLVVLSLTGRCENPPAPGTWVGIELHREVEVVEHFTLGEGVSKVDAQWWTPQAVSCFKSRGDIHIVVFGVDTIADYQRAAQLGIDAVMTDSPKRLAMAKADSLHRGNPE